jgi:hypothetical protein
MRWLGPPTQGAQLFPHGEKQAMLMALTWAFSGGAAGNRTRCRKARWPAETLDLTTRKTPSVVDAVDTRQPPTKRGGGAVLKRRSCPAISRVLLRKQSWPKFIALPSGFSQELPGIEPAAKAL